MEVIKAHALTEEEVLNALKSSTYGLSYEEASLRLRKHGRNELEHKKESLYGIFIRQFKNPLIYVLLLASLFSFVIGKLVDASLIAVIVILNALIGFLQEYKATASLEALRKLTELKTKVLRDGNITEVMSSEIVPGDVVLLEEGDVVPADMRLLEAEGLLLDESVLTGESLPVEKYADTVHEEEKPLYERKNVLFKGTSVVRGRAKGVVYATGYSTELGKISTRAQEESPETPLLSALGKFSKVWLSVLLATLSMLLLVGLLQGRELYEVVLLVIAELVSAVPEGLPIVITLVLVVGAIRLSRRKTYVRSLPAVETLGSTTYIATDKTGTITEGRLQVREKYERNPYMLRLIATLCNNSEGRGGDPVESALIEWLSEEGFEWRKLRERCPRIKEFPFDSRRRLMATVNLCDGAKILLVKGALESLLAMSKEVPRELLETHDRMADEGLRVLAFGCAEYSEELELEKVKELEIVGLIGFIDPPKEGVKEAVLEAQRAGIRIVMLTGDSLRTARSVAREVGIYREGDWALEGRHISEYSDKELYKALEKTSVIARALPEDKYRIVRVLQSNGEVVAVTGDGVNDVPALKVADIGIAMGSGAQSAQEVANMVITDNNLSVIVEAVRLGRVIAGNVRRAILYLLSASFGEVLLISLSFLLKLPIPLYPTQILWINLVTDGVQDKAFPFNREEEDPMKRKPVRPERLILNPLSMVEVSSTAIFIALVNLFLFLHLLGSSDYTTSVSVVFTSMVANQWVVGIQTVRSKPFLYKPWLNFTANPWIYLGLSLGIPLQLIALYVLPEVFHAKPLGVREWAYVGATSLGVFLLIELRKALLTLRKDTGGARRVS